MVKRLLRHERKQMEREIRAENEYKIPSLTSVQDSIIAKIKAIENHSARQKLPEGWTKVEGRWIPPGWGPIPGYQPPPAAEEERGDGEETPRLPM